MEHDQSEENFLNWFFLFFSSDINSILNERNFFISLCNTIEHNSSWGVDIIKLVTKFIIFLEPKGWLPWLLDSITGPYLESYDLAQIILVLFLSMPETSKWYLLFSFSCQDSECFCHLSYSC
jgi:hypothetical protein